MRNDAAFTMTRPVSSDTSIAARFRHVAASMPEALALVGAHARFTYGELDRWSDAIAADIVALDPPRESPVAIVMRHHVTVVPALLAVLKAGRFVVALDGAEPEDRIGTVLDAAGAELCLAEDVVPAALRNRTVLRAGVPRSPSSAPPDGPPHELLQVAFTSGTTGAPKGVAIRQRGIVEGHVLAAMRTGRGLGERVSYTAMPGAARARGEILGSLLNGATLCAFDARGERLDALADLIERERISILTLTPALFRRFMRAVPAGTDLSSVRKLRISGDVVSMTDVDAWRTRFPASTSLECGYSSTESGNVMHAHMTRDTPVPGPLVPMGRPIAGVDAWVIDEEGNEAGDDVVGELVVRSAYVARGYWNAPELTRETFTFDASRPDTTTVRTGDLVKRGADGTYYFVGRADSRVKIHGRRIDPVEVEGALVRYAGVRDVVALAEPGADGELHLAAWVVPGVSASGAREVRAALRGNVPDWMIPARVHLLGALPTTPNGKVDRHALALRAPVEELADDAPLSEDGVSDTERTILAIWSRVLRTRVGLDDDFFDELGGGSLAALEIVTEISRVTGRSVPLSLLLELNTVRKLSSYLDARPDTERTVIALQGEGALPPLFCVCGKGGSVIYFRALSEALGREQPFYGVTHHGIDPRAFPTSMAALAACYAEAIRERQPAGPYYLAGYSAGGYVAYELARQLVAAGEEVAFVGLLDALAGKERAPLWKRYGKYASIFRSDPGPFVARIARALGRRARWAARWLRNGGTRPFNPATELNRSFDLLDLQQSLKPYSGPVTLFLARYGRGTDRVTRDAGWGALCGKGLEIIDVEGEHDTMLSSDVAGLARELSRVLARARARVGDSATGND